MNNLKEYSHYRSIRALMESLSRTIQRDFYLKYITEEEKFCVCIEHDDKLVIIPGTRKKSAVEALKKAIERWNARSAEQPFVFLSPPR